MYVNGDASEANDDILLQTVDGHVDELEGPFVVEESKTLDGFVWIVFFAFVILLAIVANLTLLILTVVVSRRKCTSVVYILLNSIFLLNIVDFSILAFQFSMGVDQQFVYGQNECTVYQIVLRSVPILQAFSVVALLALNSTDLKRPYATVTIGLIGIFLILAIPTGLLANVVENANGDAKHCEIRFNSKSPVLESFYHFTYSVILSYWLPLLISFPLMFRICWSSSGSTTSSAGSRLLKYPESSVVLWTCSTFFVFFLPYSAATTFRLVMQTMAPSHLNFRETWVLQVVQSLFLLMAYFWHFARAALAILLDPDLKSRVCGLSSVSGESSEDLDETAQPLFVYPARGSQRPQSGENLSLV